MLIDVEVVRERQAQIRREAQAINGMRELRRAARRAGAPAQPSGRLSGTLTIAARLLAAMIGRCRPTAR
jgi:hypothetical protein